MQRCPHCQFSVDKKAKLCGWCGATVRGGLPHFLSRGTQKQARGKGRRHALTPPSSLIGIPGMAPLVADPPTTGATAPAWQMPPGGTAPGGTTRYPTAPMAGGWPATSTLTTTMHPTTGALPYTPLLAPTPPPPQFVSPTPAERWWPVALAALALLAWALARGEPFWSGVLQTAGRVSLAGGALLSLLLLYRRLALRRTWRRVTLLAIAAMLLLALGGMASVLATPADMLQGQQAAQRDDYAQAIAIYHHAGDAPDVARMQIAWGGKLIDQGDYATAKRHLADGLTAATGATRNDGRAALGRLYWQWGQRSLQQGQIADARAEWTLATAQAAGTPAADRAAAALSAPQNVTGHVTWLGLPLPALHLALISSWHYVASSQSLESSGERLEATADNNGAFTFSGAKPGVTYALIWVGTFGDTTRVDAQGDPLYTVTARSLESASIGTVDIGTTPPPASNNQS